MKDAIQNPFFWLVLILALGLVAVSYTSMKTADENLGISVSGTAIKSVAPDQAEINIGVVVQEDTAKEAEDENAEIMADVMDSLKELGLTDDEIETVSFNVYPEYDYDERPPELEGYRATHTLKITTEDIGIIGEVIDAATDAGANDIGEVDFSLSKDYQEELRIEILGEAAADAREKADAVAKGLRVKVGKAIDVNVDTAYSPYRYLDYAFAGAEMAEAPSPTEIEPGDIEFTVNIRVTYAIR